jgi:hypothetical protein
MWDWAETIVVTALIVVTIIFGTYTIVWVGTW